MRARASSWVALLLLGAVGCEKKLTSLAPFPCAKDSTCPAGLFCNAGTCEAVTSNPLGGSISGLAGAGLTLSITGAPALTIPAGATSFASPVALQSGTAYAVSVAAHPTQPWQTCAVANGAGTVTDRPVTDVSVSCTTNRYAIGGPVTGLAGTGLTLQGPAATAIGVDAHATSFAFTAVPSGSAYSVSVATQPTNPWQTCSVANGVGSVADADIATVAVSCTTNAYTIRGSVSGLTGAGLSLSATGEPPVAVSAGATTFAFSESRPSGTTYSVAVAAQPAGLVCVVENATGMVQSSDVWVSVTCTPGFFQGTGAPATARVNHTATLLPNGKVLIAGGRTVTAGVDGPPLRTAELYDPATGTYSATGSLAVPRQSHAATLLPNGLVLVVGGVTNTSGAATATAELYNPATGAFTSTGSMGAARGGTTATRLSNGSVLVVGGAGASAELYNPAAGTFAPTGSMTTGRYGFTTTALPNGLVLVAGGNDGNFLNSAETYDPVAGTFTATGSMATARLNHRATLLPSGLVLVTGGYNPYVQGSAELFDPASRAFRRVGDMVVPRYSHTMTVLGNGLVLIAGGSDASVTPNRTAEVFDPTQETFTSSGSLATAREAPTATLLPTGLVLVHGGVAGGNTVGSAELYAPGGNGPSAQTFRSAGGPGAARTQHTATLLPNGKVLIAGGVPVTSGATVAPLTAAELYDPLTATYAGTGSLGTPRQNHAAALLPNGRVLIAGGYTSSSGTYTATAELYDPATGTFTPTGNMVAARTDPVATTLPNGLVLIVGGAGTSAELYDARAGTFSSTGNMNAARQFGMTVTLLPSGLVLLTGGSDGGFLGSAETYDPATGTFTSTGALTEARQAHCATLLPNGQVLVLGGYNPYVLSSAELYDPASRRFTQIGNMLVSRESFSSTLLSNGLVLIAGGTDAALNQVASAELYDPTQQTFAMTGSLGAVREHQTATRLASGLVLVHGGNANGNAVASAELYVP